VNKQETVALIALLDRAGLTKARQGMEDAWLLVLEPFRAQDALEAARRIIATRGDGNTWVVPGDVIAEIALVRRERAYAVTRGALVMPPPEIDPDDVRAYDTWLKTFVRSLGDGMQLKDAEQAAAEAAGIAPVHRAIEEYRGEMSVRQIESGNAGTTCQAAQRGHARSGAAAAREALEAAIRAVTE